MGPKVPAVGAKVYRAGNAGPVQLTQCNFQLSKADLAAVQAQVDPAHRRLFLEEAERVMLQDHPAIPIYFWVSKYLVRPEVQGWGDNVLDYHYSQHLSLKAVN